MKRAMDICLSVMALLMLWPVMLILTVAIRVTSPGRAIFAQMRAGQNGKPFMFYKFRSMRMDVDPYGASPKCGSDPRLTRVGQFIRETSLDELPQLFNVLKGDMSLVGPRPLYVSQITEWNERQNKRLMVKPGLTGLAQISGRGDLTIEQKLELDVQYVETQSLALDCEILWRTMYQVVKRDAIYEKRYSETHMTRGVGTHE